MPSWIADPTSIYWLKALDFWFGAIGFFVTFATFALGWLKLQKVQNIAAAASAAANEAKIRVSRHDTLLDITKAVLELQALIEVDFSSDWKLTVKSLSDLKSSALMALRHIEIIDAKAAAGLRTSGQTFGKFVTVIDAAEAGQGSHPDVVLLKRSLRKMNDNLKSAQRILQENLS